MTDWSGLDSKSLSGVWLFSRSCFLFTDSLLILCTQKLWFPNAKALGETQLGDLEMPMCKS